ncbi:potassium channel family protein [Thiocapsa rosea]|uniref:potassium channel family protein n=1 Tax=Thiocapsa rosea TaxID=69360 RepID=UPI000EB5BB86|nr:potassium channel family protein [Thiocapsa rosea]
MAALLLLLMLYILVVTPMYGTPLADGGLISITFSLILLTGVFATAQYHATRFGIVIIALMAFASHWVHFVVGGTIIHLVDTAGAILFFMTQAYFTVQRVFREGPINSYRILGAIAGYLIIGMIFANIYLAIALVSPDAFRFAPGVQINEPPLPELVYFSFVTLTTVGFGDITPLHPMARSVVATEALIGQLYPAILIARLVTLYRRDP